MSLVAMMRTTDLPEGDDLAGIDLVYRAALRTILVEREMGSRLGVILKVRRQHAPQATLTDRAASYGPVFRNRLQAMEIKEVVTAARSPWAVPDGQILISIANRAESPCDATGSRLPA